jgi:hypothetical protein
MSVNPIVILRCDPEFVNSLEGGEVSYQRLPLYTVEIVARSIGLNTKMVLFGLVFALVFDLGQPAHAYLDPGTGSIILQLLLGGVAGFMVIGKLYWQRLKDFFGRGDKKPAEGPGESKE